MNQRLLIDREFSKLTIPMSDEARKEFENSIAENGCTHPIKIWGSTIIDGHKRYRVCRQYSFKFTTEEIMADSRESIIEHMCRERCTAAKERNAAFKYICGKWYLYGAINCKKEKRKKWITNEIADALGVCTETVNGYARFAKWLDYFDEIDHGIVDNILCGKIALSMNEIQNMTTISWRAFRKKKLELYEKCGIPIQKKPRKGNVTVTTETGGQVAKPEILQIKSMPVYDPDAEMKSLTFTLPTWANILNQSLGRMNVERASPAAKEKLMAALTMMRGEIEKAEGFIQPSTTRQITAVQTCDEGGEISSCGNETDISSNCETETGLKEEISQRDRGELVVAAPLEGTTECDQNVTAELSQRICDEPAAQTEETTDTGCTDNGCTDAGCAEVGCAEAGSTETGCTETGCTEAGFTDAGCAGAEMEEATAGPTWTLAWKTAEFRQIEEGEST